MTKLLLKTEPSFQRRRIIPCCMYLLHEISHLANTAKVSDDRGLFSLCVMKCPYPSCSVSCDSYGYRITAVERIGENGAKNKKKKKRKTF